MRNVYVPGEPFFDQLPSTTMTRYQLGGSMRSSSKGEGVCFQNKPRTAEICFGELARVSITAWKLGGYMPGFGSGWGLFGSGWGLMTEAMHEHVKERVRKGDDHEGKAKS